MNTTNWTMNTTNDTTPPASAAGSATWPYVLEFARAMEFKLSKNRHKGDRNGWMSSDPDWLMARLVGEMLELKTALRRMDREAVLLEAADVANYAMMIADRIGALPNPNRSGGEETR